MTAWFIFKISFVSEVLPRSVYRCHVEKENMMRLATFKYEVPLFPIEVRASNKSKGKISFSVIDLDKVMAE